ncbi:MAG TPA: GGDEF domain-containing protein [Candidatus Dormibacteraeota bacterium]|nr:GGDEF domain-containing protein [Candidatus Dormibacteraeota bacterium]
MLRGGNPTRVLAWATVVSIALLTAGCLFLPKGMTAVAVSDGFGTLLLVLAMLAFVWNGMSAKGRVRWFWLLQAAGWALWLGDQLVWDYWDLVIRRRLPDMYPADALLFLAGAPMIAGLLLRPHRQQTSSSGRLGLLDFLLLLLWWLDLYVSFVVCWQYPSPNVANYSRNFDLLSQAESVLMIGVLLLFWRQSQGRWKRFYASFAGAAAFNAVAFFLINRALGQGVYYTGSWYDILYCGSFAIYAGVALWGKGLTAAPEAAGDESYGSWMANLAMMALLSLPIIALVALLDPRLPHAASNFRVLVTLATMFLMAFLLFMQHRRLNRELSRTNSVLQEASLTDPLTGLRNRRYFTATIEGDVGQALRSHADKHDAHTRDLVFYLIDADSFKEVNDRYGHDVGDTVLVEMARRLSSSIRHSDVLVRWGGEEFLIVSRYTDRAEAELLAQRVLSAVADTPFQLGGSGETIYRSCSLGWAAFPWYPNDPRAVSYEEVLTLADRGLNRAKRAGKNCAYGMMPAAGKVPPTTVAGLHSASLEVDVLAVSGPHTGA